MKLLIALSLGLLANASSPGTVILPSPGTCITQVGQVSVQPTCLSPGTTQTWSVEPACCSKALVSTLVINNTVVAPLGDCCKRCVGAGDQHAEDSNGYQVTLGPCLAQLQNSCTRQKSLCTPGMCIWRGNVGAFSCEYVGVSPQIQLFQIADYGFNFTLGLKNAVQSMTAWVDGTALGTVSATNCQVFSTFGTRNGFSVTKHVGTGQVVWNVVDAQTESSVQISCLQQRRN